MLSRFVIAFLPRSKHLLISWLLSLSVVILEPKKIVSHCFHCFPIYFPWSDGTGCHDFRFLNIILKEMGISVHLTCLLRNLYAGQEATVRTRHGTPYWFKIEKGAFLMVAAVVGRAPWRSQGRFESIRWWGAVCWPPNAACFPSMAWEFLCLIMLLPTPASGTLFSVEEDEEIL